MNFPSPPPPISCQGVFLTKEKLQPYFDGGVKRVVVSAPVKEVKTSTRGMIAEAPVAPNSCDCRGSSMGKLHTAVGISFVVAEQGR